MSCTTQNLLLRSAHRLSRSSRRVSLVHSGARIGNFASKGRWSPHCAVPSAAASTSSADAPWLFVGLGNPGRNYDGTRHNVGFAVIDELGLQAGIELKKVELNAILGRGRLADKPVLLAKPITFMNNSGEAVGKLMRYYKVPAERVLVIADDLDLPLGKVRLRQKGGHGGHNGLRSIGQHMQGADFPRLKIGEVHLCCHGGHNGLRSIGQHMQGGDFARLKIGIGRPQGRMPVPTFVLQAFSKQEETDVLIAIQDACDICRAVLKLGWEKALSGSRV